MVSTVTETITQCLEAQVEEIEVLRSIYSDEWKTENEADRSYSIDIQHEDFKITLYVTLPENYPSESPPTYTLLAPNLTRHQKNQLSNLLDEVYFLDLTGVTHGEQIIDRKSVFQGHAAIVFSTDEVRHVINELKKNKKIAKATHNMYAYRIVNNNNTFIQDCDDDGESNAGGRLLHLLQILNVKNVLVVVSRWYGRIHLGPVRFRHINNAARQVLEQSGILKEGKKQN
ncbi:impact, putative [Pediculus humanus corporis]|uniref:Impact, putative n=1 Tax=Pediculus humanus subsp. corporis TaxID=121224 RepID=E0VDD5_PEDHC|nr:impact, putative [Pediculus humanus corporis]EEB11391.1 impact, putative [Pediculus humanus corporis]